MWVCECACAFGALFLCSLFVPSVRSSRSICRQVRSSRKFFGLSTRTSRGAILYHAAHTCLTTCNGWLIAPLAQARARHSCRPLSRARFRSPFHIPANTFSTYLFPSGVFPLTRSHDALTRQRLCLRALLHSGHSCAPTPSSRFAFLAQSHPVNPYFRWKLKQFLDAQDSQQRYAGSRRCNMNPVRVQMWPGPCGGDHIAKPCCRCGGGEPS